MLEDSIFVFINAFYIQSVDLFSSNKTLSTIKLLIIYMPNLEFIAHKFCLINRKQVVSNNCLLREINIQTIKKEDIPFEANFCLRVLRNDYIQVGQVPSYFSNSNL